MKVNELQLLYYYSSFLFLSASVSFNQNIFAKFSSIVRTPTQFLIIFADFFQYRAITHPIFGVFAGIMFSFFYQHPPPPIPFLLKTLIFRLVHQQHRPILHPTRSLTLSLYLPYTRFFYKKQFIRN